MASQRRTHEMRPMHTVPGQHHPSGTVDIECTFSQRVLQFALNEYATDNFTHQVFVSGYDGLWAVGESMELVLADGMAAVIIRVQANFRLWAGQWQMLQTSRPVEIRLGVQFRVVNQELFITFQESDVTIPDVGALQQVVRELLQFITMNLFNKPLLSLPLQIDLAGRQERASDSTQLAMTSLHVEDGSVTIALRLVQNDVPYPPFSTTHQRASHSVIIRGLVRCCWCDVELQSIPTSIPNERLRILFALLSRPIHHTSLPGCGWPALFKVNLSGNTAWSEWLLSIQVISVLGAR